MRKWIIHKRIHSYTIVFRKLLAKIPPKHRKTKYPHNNSPPKSRRRFSGNKGPGPGRVNEFQKPRAQRVLAAAGYKAITGHYTLQSERKERSEAKSRAAKSWSGIRLSSSPLLLTSIAVHRRTIVPAGMIILLRRRVCYPRGLSGVYNAVNARIFAGEVLLKISGVSPFAELAIRCWDDKFLVEGIRLDCCRG